MKTISKKTCTLTVKIDWNRSSDRVVDQHTRSQSFRINYESEGSSGKDAYSLSVVGEFVNVAEDSGLFKECVYQHSYWAKIPIH